MQEEDMSCKQNKHAGLKHACLTHAFQDSPCKHPLSYFWKCLFILSACFACDFLLGWKKLQLQTILSIWYQMYFILFLSIISPVICFQSFRAKSILSCKYKWTFLAWITKIWCQQWCKSNHVNLKCRWVSQEGGFCFYLWNSAFVDTPFSGKT